MKTWMTIMGVGMMTGLVAGSAIAQTAGAPQPRMVVCKGAPHGILTLDADHDGTVTRQEFLSGNMARFDHMDANKDGKLSIEERNTERGPGTGMTPLKPTPPGAPLKQGAVDADGDGYVSRDEYVFNIGTIWARYDCNGDDKITPDEIAPAP